MSDLLAAVEDWIAGLPAEEFRALVARTRPPDEPLPAESTTCQERR